MESKTSASDAGKGPGEKARKNKEANPWGFENQVSGEKNRVRLRT